MATCPSAAAVEKYFPWHTNRTYIQRDAEIMQARQAQREELVKVARLLMAPLVRLEGASGSGRSVFHCEELQHRLAFISQEQVQQGYVPAPPPTGVFGLATVATLAMYLAAAATIASTLKTARASYSSRGDARISLLLHRGLLLVGTFFASWILFVVAVIVRREAIARGGPAAHGRSHGALWSRRVCAASRVRPGRPLDV